MTCPIQVTLLGHWIDCTFPAGHDPWLHSWQTPGEPGPFVMAPPASEVRNRDGGPLGVPYDTSDHIPVSPPDLHRLVLLALPITPDDDVFVERMRAASEGGQ